MDDNDGDGGLTITGKDDCVVGWAEGDVSVADLPPRGRCTRFMRQSAASKRDSSGGGGGGLLLLALGAEAAPVWSTVGRGGRGGLFGGGIA
eukprot:CAMPEP_0201695474 /NCGR_PEP_ID=MMETSP0578-20130828/7405_1 /ASSEMBLY_ACC=CAM_ASM_000663 /TAXON_ID=267565 /ORGANISM="Skeletonema grethea, Strain CCMP 1804" /LENGTH=90 /DNA_ID=CAMNT_0048181319 /DNA_START=240 /DNA_END=509 /DNA_ORIENTATION=-